MKRITLYAIISSRINVPIETAARAAIEGGAGMLQLREKNTPEEEIVTLAKKLLKITREYGVPLIINDSPEAAAMSGADGVHLGQSDGSPAAARKILGEKAIIGVTAKTLSQAREAVRMGADYLGCGAVFPTPTKANALPMTMETLSEICSAVDIPVFAIGGITPANARSLADTGITGVASVSGVFGYPTPEEIKEAAGMLCRFNEENR